MSATENQIRENYSKEKLSGALFLPYYIEGNTLFIFLQKRTADAPQFPNFFGLWGGRIEEGETPEQALTREVKEELGIEITIEDVCLLNRYEFLRRIKYAYVYELREPCMSWESRIVIGEGEYGIWFSAHTACSVHNITLEDKVVLCDLEHMLQDRLMR